MGLRESLNNDWKNSIIEYQGRKLYVVEQVELESDLYIYTINMEKLPDVEINFLKKVKDSTFAVVTDMKLFDELMANVGVKLAAQEVEKIIKEKAIEKSKREGK